MLHAMTSFDLVVVGAGIVGLAHALAGAKRGLRVAVLERDSRASSASMRNFGFVTVSGQEGGVTRARALRSREIWIEAARDAAIDVHQRGALVVARRLSALAVLEEFSASEMGVGCEMLTAQQARQRLPQLCPTAVGALSSIHELRVEARQALPRLADWLERRHGVTFMWDTAVLGFEGSTVRHAGGELRADAVVIAPGAAVAAFAPGLAREVNLRQCKLQMMRIASPGFTLPAVVMTDLSLLRYGGFAAMPSAARLREELEHDCHRELENGVHLIVAQASDGSLVVGDSHHYSTAADPFSSTEVDSLILGELRALLDIPPPVVTERWLGYYPTADVTPVLSESLAPRVRLVSVTSGTGMSTAFAIGEETLAELF